MKKIISTLLLSSLALFANADNDYIYKISNKTITFDNFVVDKNYVNKYPENQRLEVVMKLLPMDIIYNEIILNSAIFNKMKLKESLEEYKNEKGEPLTKYQKIDKAILLWKEAMINLIEVPDNLIEEYYYSHLYDYNIPDSVEVYYISSDKEAEVLKSYDLIKFSSEPKMTLMGKQQNENKKYYLGYLSKEEFAKYFGDASIFDRLNSLDNGMFYHVPVYFEKGKEYMIFYVNDKMKAKTVDLEKAKPQIKEKIKEDIFNKQIVELLTNLSKKTELEVNKDLEKILKEK